jgi:uncharacterized protein
MTAATVTPTQRVTRSHTPTQTVLLHLLPGVAAFAGYVGLVPLARELGLPSVAVLATVGLLVIAPVQLGLLWAHRRRRPDEPAVLLRARLPLPRLLGWAGLEVALAGLAFLATLPLKRLLQDPVFAWWPDAWTVRDGTETGYTDTALIVTAALLLIGTVLVAPVVEEIYFRGYLLPRMPRQLGRWTVPAHVAPFAAYHLSTPWLVPTRIIAVLPLAYIALRTRDVHVGIVAHVLLNTADLLVLLVYVGTR